MEANTTLLTWFVALTGFAVLLQACLLLGIFLALRKTAQSVSDVTREVKGTIIPLAHSTRELVEKISPQVKTVSAGLVELTNLVQTQGKAAGASISEVRERAQTQVKRVDHMLTVALDGIEKTAGKIEHSVAAPVRQVNGVVAALKAMVGTYRSTPSSARRGSTPPPGTTANSRPGYVRRDESIDLQGVPDPYRDTVL